MKSKNQLDIRERVRAARVGLDACRNPRTGEVPKDQEVAAFMSIFHPNIKGKRLKAFLGSLREQ